MMRALEARVAGHLEASRRTTDLEQVRALVRLVALTECPARELVKALRARLDGGFSLEAATDKIIECWQNQRHLLERDELASPGV